MPIYALTVARSGPKLRPARDRSLPSSDLIHAASSSGELNLDNVTMKQFSDVLSRKTDRQVVDATTGISGSFDIALSDEPSRDRSGLSVFTALQRQLDLKLEPRNEPVEVLIVRSAQR